LLLKVDPETPSYIYGMRLTAFVFILIAIWNKNRKPT